MKLPLLLAGAGAAIAVLLAFDSGVLSSASKEAPVAPLVRVANRIDGAAIAGSAAGIAGAAAGIAGAAAGIAGAARGGAALSAALAGRGAAFAPSYPLTADAAATEDDGPLRLDLAVPDPFGSSGFGADPLAGSSIGELDPALLVGMGSGEHVGKAAPSGLPVPAGVGLITWEDIALVDYEPPTPFAEEDYTKEEIFPAELLVHDGQSRALEGFMQPIAWEGDKVTTFLLSPYPPGCCFGGMPGFDEWIDVEMADGSGVEFHAYRTVRVTGTFEVGESFDDYGYLSSIYRIRGESVERMW